MVMELNYKMDLNKQPAEMEKPDPFYRNEDGQAELKKRKHGEPLDFEGPYFTTGGGTSNNRNARIKVKSRKSQIHNSKGGAEEFAGEEELPEQQQHLVSSEAPVAGYKPPGAE
ncbi:unnamed protein product [Linum trigynum]|uniref:Uncharacterized protein n=1 Tax=Linum trigynum TaxID=586398 RepID=A0AAV2D0H9_9ROSI